MLCMLSADSDMYSVVVFPPESDDSDGEEEVEAVPSVWLSPGRTQCRWPPFRSQEAIGRAITTRMLPAENWHVYTAKLKGKGMYGKCYLLLVETNAQAYARHFVC